MPVSYRQYCPVARASEILAERWSLLIVRNLLFGASTFSAIAGGVPSMSRSMLVKRLRELERAGVIVSERKPNGNGCVYRLTPAGADLASVIDSLGHWAERWVEVLPQHLDPGFALWAWCQVQLDRAQLPARRVVVRFVFPDEQPGNQRYWLLVDHGGAELCQSDPGGDADLQVTANTRAFIDWHRGALTWSEATRDGRITVEGDRTLARSLPRWNTQTPVLDH